MRGRICPALASGGTLLDLGGQWIGPTQYCILALAKSVGATTFPTYVDKQNIEYCNGQRSLYSGAIPMHDPLEAMEVMLDLNYGTGGTAGCAVAGSPCGSVGLLDGSYMDTNVTSEGARMWMTLAVQAVFSAEPRDPSLLHFLFYVHTGGSLNELVSVTRDRSD